MNLRFERTMRALATLIAKSLLLALAAGLLAPTTAGAQGKTGTDVSTIPMSRCTTQAVVDAKRLEALRISAEGAEVSLPILAELSKINSEAKDPGKPIKEQLPEDRIRRFDELSARLSVIDLGDYVEARRDRDLEALQRMVMLADQFYRFDNETTSDPEAELLSAIISLMREDAKKSDWPLNEPGPTASTCSFSAALNELARPEAEKLDPHATEMLTASVQQMNALKAKYKTSELDLSKMSAADRDAYLALQERVRPTLKVVTYVSDLSHIGLMADVADLNYRLIKQDVISGGGDINAIGRSASKMAQTKELTPAQIFALALWGVINEKIDSRWRKEKDQIAKSLDQPKSNDTATPAH